MIQTVHRTSRLGGSVGGNRLRANREIDYAGSAVFLQAVLDTASLSADSVSNFGSTWIRGLSGIGR